jgi:hypothetical protein
MNNRNDRLRTREDVAEYMKKICKNAEKHGLYITIVCGECGYLSELSTVINYEIMQNQRKADTFAALFELQKQMLHWDKASESEKAEIRQLMSKEWLTMEDTSDLIKKVETQMYTFRGDNRGKD